MAFIYDRKDGTIIEYNPMDRIRFLCGVPERVINKDNVKIKSNPDAEKKPKGPFYEHAPENYFRSVEKRQRRG